MFDKEPKCPIAQMVCPRNNDPKKGKYCPVWKEYMETEVGTGKERLQKECGFSAMFKFLEASLAAANRPAAAIENNTNEIAKGFSAISTGLQNLQQLQHTRERKIEAKDITYDPDSDPDL